MKKPATASICDLLKRNQGLTYCDDGDVATSSDAGGVSDTAALNALDGGTYEPCSPNRGTLGSVRQERGAIGLF